MGKPNFELFKEDCNKYCQLFDAWVNEIHKSHFEELQKLDSLQQHVGSYVRIGDKNNVIDCIIKDISYVLGLGHAQSLNEEFLYRCTKDDVIKHSSVQMYLTAKSNSYTYLCICNYGDDLTYVLPYYEKKQIDFIHNVGDKVKVLIGTFNRELTVSNCGKDGNDYICDLSDENGVYIGSFEDSKLKRIGK